jgi:hypothetical protein
MAVHKKKSWKLVYLDCQEAEIKEDHGLICPPVQIVLELLSQKNTQHEKIPNTGEVAQGIGFEFKP